MTSRHWLRDWGIIIVGTLLFGVVACFVYWKIFDPQFGQTVVLALTAIVILWYTVETMRLRRDAEARAERDREPHIFFDIEQFPGNVSSSQFRFYFLFRNESPNPALARIRMRLQTNSGPTILSPRKGYDGQQTWEVIPFFAIRGWFDLNELINAARQAANAPTIPSGDMQLNVQVDVYRLNRRHLVTLNREYHMCVFPSAVQFWPEVATTLSKLPTADELS